MPELTEGEPVEVSGSTGRRYTLERRGDVISCSCPAWRNQRAPAYRRSCKHLRAHLGENAEAARVGAGALRRPKWSTKNIVDEAPYRRARRRAALHDTLARAEAVEEHMLRVYGMPLPRHLAYAIGFWRGLTADERDEAWAYMGTGPCGVSEWYAEGGLAMRRIDALDERLHYRFRADPPEFVTVFGGNSDGSHWGLWYDDPHALPRELAHNWARDSAETGPSGPTLLHALREDLERAASEPEWRHARAILSWMHEVQPQEWDAYASAGIGAPPPRTHWAVGGMDPIVPGVDLPQDLIDGHQERYEAYRAGDPRVLESIARAREELAEGSPLRALFLGRELHWMDADPWRAECTELLVSAYEALGRGPLARIVEVHHAHRDLRSVGVYLSEGHLRPLAAAVYRDEAEAVEALLNAGPGRAELVDAFASVKSLAVARRLLAQDPSVIEEATVRALRGYAQRRAYDPENAARHGAPIIAHLLASGGARGEALIAALELGEPELSELLGAHVDLHHRDRFGATPLHVAAAVADLTLTTRCLDRGADPTLKDLEGRRPLDLAMDAWGRRISTAAAVIKALKAALKRASEPPEGAAEGLAEEDPLAVDARVSHAKFGLGTIREVAGDKLTVLFDEGGEKRLLRRFVSPWPRGDAGS